MRLNGFDRIAFLYDFLATLVFGRAIMNSQKYFLDEISGSSKILILGGGSGDLLAALLKRNPYCEVWYIEASKKMITLSISKIKPECLVHFIHGTEQEIPTSIKYDAAITNFYLDLFTDPFLEDVVNRIQSVLKPGACWLATDFIKGNPWWQKEMLRIMYWFFSITCHIEPKQLPDWTGSMEKAGGKEIKSKAFYSGFIKTSLYQY